MRRFRSLPIFSLLLMLMPVAAYSQAWSSILSPSRAINWTGAGLPATLPSGETTPNPWTPPTRTQCGSTIAAGASAATINAALAACSKGYVLLGAGTFNVSNANITMYAQNGVTLRGSGPQSTTLALSGSSQIQLGSANYGSGTCSWTSGFSAGTTSITLTGCSGLAAGQLLYLQQCNTGFSGSGCTNGSPTDNGGIYVCSGQNACQRSGEGSTQQQDQEQVVLITAVTGSGSGPLTVTFSPGLYLPNWSSSNTPTASWTNGAHKVSPNSNGLEDMTIYTTNSTQGSPVGFNDSYASWIKGVRFLGSGLYEGLSMGSDKNCLVMNNYFFTDIAIDGLYPPGMQQGSDSDDLVINNFITSGVPWEGTGSMEGDVIAYNYTRDNFTTYVLDMFEHNAGNAFTLYEGNQTPSIQEDDTHGTHDLSTLFRNYVFGWEAPYVSQNFAAVDFDAFDRFTNSVGNVLGGPHLTNYQSTLADSVPNFVYDFSRASSAHSDPLTLSTSLRWANYDTVTGAVRYCGDSSSPGWSSVCSSTSEIPTSLTGNAAPFSNSVPSTTDLPCSFFLANYTSTTCAAHPNGGSGLNWWKVCTSWASFPTSCAATNTPPFPPIGPDVTGGPYNSGYAYDIPAALAFQHLPVDPAFQKSYSVTNSSWSNGTETLTVSGLPNMEHLLGPFQISGGVCGTGTSEAFMTSSSSTTISYALASDPGSCAGGTFKFPDVRQFDERVYLADGAGGVGNPPPPPPTAPNPPSKLTASPQ